MRRRRAQHGVGDDDRRRLDRIEEVDDRVTVRAGVEAVLVLDDHDIGSRQRVHALARWSRVAIGERCHDARIASAARVADPDDGDVVATACEPVAQRGGEGRDAARRRRERRDDRIGPAPGHWRRRTIDAVDVVQLHEVSSRQLGRDVEPARATGSRPSSPNQATHQGAKASVYRGQPHSAAEVPSSVDRSVQPHQRRSLRIAVLAPIAWRVPPVHYGPWEQFASLLTEGLVDRGHDVTLFATANSVTPPRWRPSCRTAGLRPQDSTPRSPSARTSPPPSSAPASSTSSTTASTSSP